MLMVHNRELVWRHELRRGKIGETILSIFMNHKYNRMRKIKKMVKRERERERERERAHCVATHMEYIPLSYNFRWF